MSNFLAIATVTAALGLSLQGAIGTDVPGATVTTLRPDGSGGAPSPHVNLYLYQITPNAAWRNADLPTRTGNGQIMQRPQTALDLHYLLTFYGDEARLEPQRMLGSAVRTLHAQPVLTPPMIQNATSSATFPFLASSDLARQIELVKFTPLPLSLEELSKLWSVFFQTQYALTAAYQGTVVLIDSDDTPREALPVRQRNAYVLAFRQPLIEQVTAQQGADAPIVAGSTLVVRGQRLRGDVTHIAVAGTEVALAPAVVSDTQINVTLAAPPLPAGRLRAGAQGIQVVHPVLMGTPPTLHRGVASNMAAFVLRPTITNVNAPNSAAVLVHVDPIAGRAQRVILLLNGLPGSGGTGYSFPAKDRSTDTSSITFPIAGVPAGMYLARVQVDGAESPLAANASGQFVAPTVAIP